MAEFRKDYSAAVIFGKGTVDEFLDTAATNVDKLLKQNCAIVLTKQRKQLL
ncbi:MAG: hypothetical protein ACLT4Y_11485 [Bifidobacterium breve]